MKFDPKYFPKYYELSKFERLFLRTCCYFPPILRRQIGPDSIEPIQDYVEVYERAFGKESWSFIKGKRVLDLGCGKGGYVLALASRGAGWVVGVDIQRIFIHAYRMARKRRYNNVAFIQGDIEMLRDDSFDVVISHDAFEHYAEPERVFKQMARVVKTGGHILIKTGSLWYGPWGRHMSGTVRKDRPWIHLIISERVVMRCHSVYHNDPVLLERYSRRPGGLNKMSLRLFYKIIRSNKSVRVMNLKTSALFSMNFLLRIPFIKELFAGDAKAHCIRIS